MKRSTFFLLGIILIGAFSIRVFKYIPERYQNGGGYVFSDVDSYYYSKMTKEIYRHYPKIPTKDPFLHFPYDGTIPWPNGNAFFIASYLKLTNLFNRGLVDLDSVESESKMGMFNVYLVLITILIMFSFFKRIFGEIPALMGCFLFSLLPMNIFYSCYGYIDHHIFAGTMILLTLFFFSLNWGVLAGISIGLGFFIHPGTSVLVVAILLTLFVSFLIKRPLDRKVYFDYALFSTLSTAFFLSLRPLDQILSLNFGMFSSFHLLLSSLALLGYFFQYKVKFNTKNFIIFGTLLAVVLWFLSPMLFQGLEYVRSENWFLGLAGESLPMFAYGESFVFGVLTPIGILSILCWPYFFKFFKKDFSFLLILVASCVYFYLLSQQNVFFAQASIFVVIAFSALCSLFVQFPFQAKIFIPLSLLFILGNVLQFDLLKFGAPKYSNNLSLDAVSRYIQNNTPPYKNDDHPDYIILSSRDEGHHINARGKRAVMLNPFSVPIVHKDSNIEFSNFLLEKNLGEVKKFFAKKKVRYQLVRFHTMEEFSYYSHLSNLPIKDFFQQNSPEEVEMTESFFQTFIMRLFFYNGSEVMRSNRHIGAVDFMQLIYESPTVYPQMINGVDYPHYKLFAYVAGATLTGKTPRAHQKVELKINLITSNQRAFTYLVSTYSDHLKRWSLKTPYPSQSDLVKPLSKTLLSVDDQFVKEVDVQADQVLEGKTIEVDLQKSENAQSSSSGHLAITL